MSSAHANICCSPERSKVVIAKLCFDSGRVRQYIIMPLRPLTHVK